MEIADQITKEKIISVITIAELKEVPYVMEALLHGGIHAIELTLRTECAIQAIEQIKKHYPEILLGVGTVITPTQVDIIANLNVAFAVAPGLNHKVLERAKQHNLSFFPGIATPSDIETALEYDIRLLKFFPAEPMGGLSFLENMNAPYGHLDIQYIPLGGVNENNILPYLQSPLVGAIGGSWIASRKLIADKQWKTIESNARNAIQARERATNGR